MKLQKLFTLLFVLLSIMQGCKKESTSQLQSATNSMLQQAETERKSKGQQLHIHFDSLNFVDGINNPYLPLVAGTFYHYIQIFQDGGKQGVENIQIEVMPEIKLILGVNCEVVHDVVYEKGEVSEDTYDWFAQDKEGNVWYMGESTKKREGNTWVTTGSWEGGVNGAKPGIVMLAHPEQHVGEIYRQEYLKDSAQDKAMVISTNSTTSIQLGTFANCVVTEETSKLDPGVKEYKYYAPGIGNISTILNVGGREHEELVGIKK